MAQGPPPGPQGHGVGCGHRAGARLDMAAFLLCSQLSLPLGGLLSGFLFPFPLGGLLSEGVGGWGGGACHAQGGGASCQLQSYIAALQGLSTMESVYRPNPSVTK